MKKQTKGILAGVLILLALIRLVAWMTAGDTPPEASRHYEVLGNRSAELAADLLGGGGAVLLLLHEEPEIVREAFTSAAEAAGLEVAGVVRAASGETHPELGLREEFYQRIASEYPDVDVVVSFSGAPPAEWAERPLPPPFHPGFIAVLPYPPTLPTFLRLGLVHRAIVPSGSVPEPPPDQDATVDAWFKAYYRVLTPETAPPWDAGVPPAATEPEFIDKFVTPLNPETTP